MPTLTIVVSTRNGRRKTRDYEITEDQANDPVARAEVVSRCGENAALMDKGKMVNWSIS